MTFDFSTVKEVITLDGTVKKIEDLYGHTLWELAQTGRVKISCNNNTSWMIINGDLYGCGRNFYGQQGNGTSGSGTDVTTFTQRATNVSQVFSTLNTTWYITNTGELYGCGRNNNGQQGSGDTTDVTTFTQKATNVAQINIIDSESWYVTNTGILYGCGNNNNGQQGSGDTISVTTFTQRATNVSQIYVIDNATWYVTNTDEVYGCGNNLYGQQGSGDTINVTTFIQRYPFPTP